MRFPRLPDGQRSYSLLERDDGVCYRIHQGVAGRDIPHDLVHLIVERETDENGGFWGAVVAGAVFGSMEHLAGRRPPHVRARSLAAIRERDTRLMRAELMAGLVEHVAHHQLTSRDQVRAAAREALSTLPDTTVNEDRVIQAGRVLRETERHWASLEIGEELVVDWATPRGSKKRSRRRPAPGPSR